MSTQKDASCRQLLEKLKKANEVMVIAKIRTRLLAKKFQNCLVADQVVVKQKLQQTLKILFDFEHRYGELKAKALLNIWCKYSSFIDEVANEAYVQSLEGLSEWSNDVESFLTLLKLLPSTAGERETKRAKVLKLLESFINFEELHTPIENYKVGSQQPTIIAVGENKTSISQYFISLDGKCINLPLEFNFVQAYDLYFKCFYVFNIQFDITLANFLRYFSKCIYQIDEKKGDKPKIS